MTTQSKQIEWAMKAVSAQTMGQYIECQQMATLHERISAAMKQAKLAR